MACGSCAKRRNNSRSTTRTTNPEDYDISDGVDIKSLNDRQIRARLEIFKRKFCRDCSKYYDCDYANYLGCKGLNKR